MLIACLFSFVQYWNLVIEYGFWRQDAWKYSSSEITEFKLNLRWVAPAFHKLLGAVPANASWTLAFLLFWYVGYVIVSQFLGDERLKVLAVVISSCFVINPAFISQLHWPTHSLAGIVVLAIMAYLSKRFSKRWVVIIGTIVLFGTLQTFSFLSLLFLLPNQTDLAKNSLNKNISNALISVFIWLLAIVAGYLVAKLMQYSYFGYLPELPSWRQAHPVSSVYDLVSALGKNLTIFISHLKLYFYESWIGIGWFAWALACLVLLLLQDKLNRPLMCIFPLLLYVLPVMLSSYLITAPLGTVISIRLGLVIGCSFAVLVMLFFWVTNSKVLVGFMLILILLPAHKLIYANMAWFSSVTTNIKQTISELVKESPQIIDSVYVITDSAPWPALNSHLFRGIPAILEGVRQASRVDPAFIELDLPMPIWCAIEKGIIKADCNKLKNHPVRECSQLNSKVCRLASENNRLILSISVSAKLRT